MLKFKVDVLDLMGPVTVKLTGMVCGLFEASRDVKSTRPWYAPGPNPASKGFAWTVIMAGVRLVEEGGVSPFTRRTQGCVLNVHKEPIAAVGCRWRCCYGYCTIRHIGRTHLRNGIDPAAGDIIKRHRIRRDSQRSGQVVRD